MKDKLTLIFAALVVVASVVLYYVLENQIQLVRVAVILAGVGLATIVAYSSDTGKAAWAFAKGANIERQKVVWPNRREAAMVTLMVIILVIIIGLFIALVDKILFETIYDFVLGVSE
ncbi:MAG: preprotein translocase subunit SecE [bacterium]